MGISVGSSEFHKDRLAHGDPETEVKGAVEKALGALSAAKDKFAVVSVTGDGPADVQHPEFLATIEGIVEGLPDLEPPRVLAESIAYVAMGRDHNRLVAFISTQPRSFGEYVA